MAHSDDTNSPHKVFHSSREELRNHVHVVLVRPEHGGNVGSVCRALANMGIRGDLRIVGEPSLVNGDSERMAKHAKSRLQTIHYFPNLAAALDYNANGPTLNLAATARIGSAHRPHPVWSRPAVQRAMEKLAAAELNEVVLVFGPESSGLTNEEVAACDWVVTVPSSSDYRSINLAQTVMIFAYEVNLCLTQEQEAFESDRPSQKRRLVSHMLSLAEEVGFILPEDPFKMRPRLEEILSHLPNHIQDVKTVHGFIEQVIRSVRAGERVYKGRFRQAAIGKSES